MKKYRFTLSDFDPQTGEVRELEEVIGSAVIVAVALHAAAEEITSDEINMHPPMTKKEAKQESEAHKAGRQIGEQMARQFFGSLGLPQSFIDSAIDGSKEPDSDETLGEG